MRQLVTWLLLMLAAPAAFAQGNPLLYIRPIITPATPTTADDVLLLFYARAGFQAYRINTSFSATGQQMTFTGCYQIANATISSSFIDSVKVGRLAVGTYTVSFISVEAAGGNQLCEGRRDTASLTFQVRSPLATTTRVGEGWAVYPTPAAGGALSQATNRSIPLSCWTRWAAPATSVAAKPSFDRAATGNCNCPRCPLVPTSFNWAWPGAPLSLTAYCWSSRFIPRSIEKGRPTYVSRPFSMLRLISSSGTNPT
jgi:hypothetical protein